MIRELQEENRKLKEELARAGGGGGGGAVGEPEAEKKLREAEERIRQN